MDKDIVVGRVRKLLNLSASANEHEAVAAAAKAQELLSKYNLKMSEIPSHDQSAMKAEESRVRVRKRADEWMYVLSDYTAKAFDCDYYHTSGVYGHMVFIGVGADSEVCAWTYEYIYTQLKRMVTKKYGRLTKSNRLKRESYLRAAVYSVGERLLVTKKLNKITSEALVPVKRGAIEALMPKDIREREFKAVAADFSASIEGRRDGETIPLSTPVPERDVASIL